MKPILDATLFRDVSHPLPGTHRLQVEYANELWPGRHPDRSKRPDPILLRDRAQMHAGQLVCLDIEHWQHDNRLAEDVRVEQTIDDLIWIVDTMHEAEPGLRIGYYRLMPIRDYWTPQSSNPIAWAKWRRANARLRQSRSAITGRYLARGLSDAVDVVFPSLYTFYCNMEGWERFAVGNLAEARKFGKPVYPFLWPQYHNSGTLADWPKDSSDPFAYPASIDPLSHDLLRPLVSGEFWRRQLAVCRDHADGVVIWGGWQQPWQPTAQWWQATKDFT